ncbi:MAG: hypothetical protein GY865_20170 [candidate division Zixibacteria bacterium]|nr:hypothetical protein [candidate division Zixibacteria bacterium]
MLYFYKFWKIFLNLLIFILIFSTTYGQVPQLINYQGKLTDEMGNPLNGDYQMTFRIYYVIEPGGDQEWTETHPTVAVTNGLFNVMLGSYETLPDNCFSEDTTSMLGITIGSEDGDELEPRTRLITVPYAYQALHADTAGYVVSVGANSVSSDAIIDGTIQQSDLSFTVMDEASTQTITGTKTFDDLNIAATTRTKTFSHIAFVPEDNTCAFIKENHCLMNTIPGSNNNFFAPVFLPDGAIVTRFEVSYYDGDATYNGNAYLYCIDKGNGATYTMGTVNTVDWLGMQHVFDETIDYATVDNHAFNYVILMRLRYSSSQDQMRFYGSEIEYTITKPLP